MSGLPQEYEIAPEGRDLKRGEWDGSGQTSLDQCNNKAVQL